MKKRADVLVFEKNMAPSREKAKVLILGGSVMINGAPVRNPSQMFDEGCTVRVEDDSLKYVSRGGFKLEKAMKEFCLDLTGCVCMDIGASTGGFTDCMLKSGASYVYAIDVGYGQFAWSLRNREDVKLLERTNARYLTREHVDRKVDFASIDVSFISLNLILPTFANLDLSERFSVAALIKPQFEAGKDKVGKKGVVRDEKTHIEVIENVKRYAESNGFNMEKLTYSPITGPNGNIEFLCLLKRFSDCSVDSEIIRRVVFESHKSLK